MRRAVYFSVRPRYSGGSPAQVDAQTAERVAREEQIDYERARAGVYGETQRQRAEQLGLRGTAEMMWERAGYWEVVDLVTKEHFARPFEVEASEKVKASVRRRARLPLECDLEGGAR